MKTCNIFPSILDKSIVCTKTKQNNNITMNEYDLKKTTVIL